MVRPVVVRLALIEQFKILLDEPLSAPQQKGDLPGLHALLLKLGDASKGAQVVGGGLRRVMKDSTDLAGGFSFQGQPYDLHAMGQYGADVVLEAAQRDGGLWRGFPQGGKIASDGACTDKEDAIGEIFAGEQAALAECFLAEIGDACLSKGGRALFFDQGIILGATMQGEANDLLLTLGDGLSARFIGSDEHEGNLPRGQLGLMLIEYRKVDLFDDLQDGLSLEGRAIQSLTNLGSKVILQSFATKTIQEFLGAIADPHRYPPFRDCPNGVF